jgi:hypothetical protein
MIVENRNFAKMPNFGSYKFLLKMQTIILLEGPLINTTRIDITGMVSTWFIR